ncbi:MAG: DMT family transporter [Campylobacteraceae bacterium]
MSLHTKGLFFVFFGVFLMSFESPFIKLTNLSSFTFSFYYGICIFLSTFFFLLFKTKGEILNIYRVEFLGVLLAGLCVGLSNICFISAVKMISAANTLLILATAPIFSAIFSKLLFNIKTPKRIYFLTILVLVGVFIIIYSDLKSANMLGNLFAFGCVFFFALTFNIINHFKNANRLAYISLAGIVLALFSLFFGADLVASVNKTSLFIILGLGLFVTPISRYLMGVGAKYIYPAEAGLLTILESIFAPILAIFILHEIPNTNTLIGGSIILFAIVLNILLSLRKA